MAAVAQDHVFVSPIGVGAPQGSQLLPRYLLGGGAAVHSPPGLFGSQQAMPVGMTGGLVHSTPTTGLATHGQQQALRKERDPLSTPKDKSGAPPVEGLYDQSGHVVRESTPYDQPARPGSQTPFTAMPSTIRAAHTPHSFAYQGQSPPSPAQLDPFYLHGESITSDDHYDDCWVTVFGFPPSSATYILQQFAQLGNVVKHVVAADGNWMHLKYQSRLQAVKALSKNGKVFAGGIMVGVQPCIDKGVIAEGEQSSMTAVVSEKKQSYNIRPGGGIRPLTAAYRATSSTHDVEPREANTPQKSSGLVGKVLEYVFGW